jgi:Cytochrome domain of cellobiose dehydrogenase
MGGKGSLDISSSNAGVIWALGTIPPSNPSNPDSDFQQHKVMGNFFIDMKSAQINQDTDASSTTAGTPTQTGATSVITNIVPTITGNSTVPLISIINTLTHRNKVRLFSLPFNTEADSR